MLHSLCLWSHHHSSSIFGLPIPFISAMLCPTRPDLESQCEIPVILQPSTTRADRASLSLGSAHTNPCVTDPKGASLAGLRGHLAKNLARALQVIHLFFFFFFEFILRWTVIHPEWRWAGKSPLLWKLLSCVIFTRCLAIQSISLLYQTGMS